jgi:hypothetical protein
LQDEDEDDDDDDEAPPKARGEFKEPSAASNGVMVCIEWSWCFACSGAAPFYKAYGLSLT